MTRTAPLSSRSTLLRGASPSLSQRLDALAHPNVKSFCKMTRCAERCRHRVFARDKSNVTHLDSSLEPTTSSSTQLPTKPTMFFKLFAVFAVSAVAVALPGGTTPPVTSPTSNQCCSSIVPSTSGAASAVAALVGIDLTGLDVPIGLSCSPITVVGNNCGGTTVVCDAPEAEWHDLIAINCLPITL
ncbi:Hydrophobin 2 [Mycena chlorophos]|uniref:Hydrophobin n=1 Tax=Mycena chlorophos TaxID=658473 RepID=A0A8H6S101_MYCCL|nr:Hydrophobin 2 [Mycena chlorophos]